MVERLRGLKRALPKEIAAAIYAETEIETTEAKQRTPVRYGVLRGTVHTEGPFIEDTHVYAAIAAGGPSAPYALYVHENLRAFHAVGQAKFIESVILESRPYLAARIAKRISLTRAARGT